MSLLKVYIPLEFCFPSMCSFQFNLFLWLFFLHLDCVALILSLVLSKVCAFSTDVQCLFLLAFRM